MRNQTSVIDKQPPAPGGPPPGAARLRRRVLVLAATVATLAAGAVVWSTTGADPAAAERAASPTAASSAPEAAPSSVAPSESAAATGEPTAQASSPVTTPPAVAGPTTAAPQALPAGWETRTFQGVTFAVPPGASAPDLADPGNADAAPMFSWTGPSLGDDVTAQITVRIFPAAQAPELGPEYQSLTVPGADQAHARTGPTGSEPPLVAGDVHILAGGRFINIVGMFGAGPAGEQMVRDLIASLSIG